MASLILCDLNMGTMLRQEEIKALIDQLGDPSRSNRALVELLWRGKDAAPALAEFLRSSRPSSLSEPRLLAVEGLSILKGHEALDALVDVASQPLIDIPDPVVRLAEEAVASRAAFALVDFPEPRANEVLLKLLEARPLIGVAEAFEKLKDPRAIPFLVSWLEHDLVAEPAGRAIRACGPIAVPALLESLGEKQIRSGRETGMSQRRRARILAILCDLAAPASIDGLEGFLNDPLEAVRWNAVRLFLDKGDSGQQLRAFRIGIHLLDSTDTFLRAECEEELLAHFDQGHELIEEEINRRRILGEPPENFQPRETTLAILLRIRKKGKESAEVSI